MLVLFLRAILLYVLVFAVMRLMGKRQVSDLQPFDLVVTLLIAELASDPITDPGTPLLYGVLPICALFLVQQLTAYLALKSERARGILSGKPMVIVSKGVVREDVMREASYTLNDLLEQLRSKDVFALSEVEYAILETDGSLSVLKRGERQQPAMKDLGLKAPPAELSHMLVLDGVVHERALADCGQSRDWLMGQLRAMGFSNPQDVFFLSLNTGTGELHAQARLGRRGKGAARVAMAKVKKHG